MKFGISAVTFLLLSANAFAAPQDVPANMPSIITEADLTTIEMSGQKIAALSEVGEQKVATIYLEGQPKDTQLFVTSQSVTYDDKARTATVKGKFTIEVLQQRRRLLHISIGNGDDKIESTGAVRLDFQKKDNDKASKPRQ